MFEIPLYNYVMNQILTHQTSRKARADSLRNRELILGTARRLFDEQGVNNITMSAIADSAEIGKGTLYRHFPDKAELLFTLVEHEAQMFRDEISERASLGESPREMLHWFIQQALAYALRNNSLLCEATNHVSNGTLNHPSRFWWRDVLHDLFQRAGSTTDPCYAADTIYMMLDAQTLYFQQFNLGYDGEHLSQNLHALADSLLNK